MKTVHEVAKLTGVSVRTLHHYDAVGLLHPAQVTEAGYRLYDDASLERLQSILFYRELRFSLAEIKEILDSPDYDPGEALDGQIKLLEAERRRLDGLIAYARTVKEKGNVEMKFEKFDRAETEALKKEAKERWGKTEAWKEYEKRGCGDEGTDGLMAVFARMGALRDRDPSDSDVQTAVASLQAYITDNYYTCTKEILASLGEMYVADERFRKNIDEAGGDGTAEFTRRAIEIFTK